MGSYIIKHKTWVRIIAAVVVCAFTLTSIPCIEEAHALSPWTGMQNTSLRRDWIFKNDIDFSNLEYTNPHNPALKGEDVLLRSHGKILLSETLKGDTLKHLRAIFRKEVDALMQILERQNSSRYDNVMKDILANEKIVKAYKAATPERDRSDFTAELLFNDIMASAFELLILHRKKAISRKEMTPEEWDFIKTILPKISAHEHNFFTGVFWDTSSREMHIRIAIAGEQKST
ncbi:hypothetical protein ACFL4E_03050, partial [Candidatus Omnitrophota bacterium]